MSYGPLHPSGTHWILMGQTHVPPPIYIYIHTPLHPPSTRENNHDLNGRLAYAKRPLSTGPCVSPTRNSHLCSSGLPPAGWGLSGRPFKSIVYTIDSAFRTSPLPHEMQISEVDPRNLHASGRSGLPGASQGTPLIRLLVLVGITLELLGVLGASSRLSVTSWPPLGPLWGVPQTPLGRPGGTCLGSSWICLGR